MRYSVAAVRRAGAFLFALLSIFSTAVSAGTEPAGSMASGRVGHAAVALTDGRALVAGAASTGFNPPSPAAELFDPATNTFSATGSMIEGRLFASTARLQDGRVLVAGGMITNSSPPNARSTAEIYDPVAGTWSATGSMSAGRQEGIAVGLPDGRVLVIAGDVTSRACEIYDPATGIFSPTGQLLQPRMDFVASVLADGRVLVAGGEPAWSTPAHASAEIWDPATGTWATTGSMAFGRYQAAATLLSNGKVLVTGGSTAESYTTVLAQAELYDPATGAFTSAGAMSVARSSHGAALLGNGDVVVVGGMESNGLSSKSIERFNVATGTWSSGGSLLTARRFPAATTLNNGEVLVSGGLGADATAELIDVACIATFNTLSPASAGHGSAAAVGTVTVNHVAGCAWRVGPRPSWITVTSPLLGFGNGTVTYSITENTSTFSRDATWMIGERSFTLNQAGSTCGSSSVSPTSASFGLAGGGGSFTLSTTASCGWLLTGVPSWVTYTGVTSGTGSRTFNYTVASNAGAARSATLSLAGRTHTINQAANTCIPAPTISPASRSFAFGGGTNTVSISAPSACPWTVSGTPGWIAMSTFSGMGSATLNVHAAANTGAARSATFTVAGNSFTVTQGANACLGATIGPASASVGSSAGSGAFDLTADAACAWTITGVSSWMSVTSPMSGTGNATIAYTYTENAGAARIGLISLVNHLFTLQQAAGPCSGATASPTTSPTIALAGGSGSVTVTAPPSCTWTVTSLPAWVTVTSALPMTGSGTVTYSVAANAGTARSGTLVAADASHTVSQSGVAPPAVYCPSRGNTSTYEWIQQVTIAGQVRGTGGNGGYADLTTSMAPISLSRPSNSITLSPGGSYSEWWRIWIDFNGDSSFTDNEIVYTGSGTGAISSSFAIPASAPGGTTRMRVSMKWGSAPTSCEVFTYGEVEDYTVTY